MKNNKSVTNYQYNKNIIIERTEINKFEYKNVVYLNEQELMVFNDIFIDNRWVRKINDLLLYYEPPGGGTVLPPGGKVIILLKLKHELKLILL